ncbi:MAG: DUF222 domain-containing protein, partial [Burkholderiaceae bacterium]|nr:DUF222 domain-containing protein [Burkholderiaceae bacterium]
MEMYDDDDTASTGRGPSPASSASASASEDSPAAGALSGVAASARAGWEAENRAAAQRLSAAHRLMVECLAHPDCRLEDQRPGFAVVDPLVMACSHLVRMFPISTYKAEAMISFAADLHFRYPAILEAMAQGRMDQAAGHVLAGQMGYVAEEVLPAVQQQVVDDYLATVEAGERPGARAVAERADRVIAVHDPAGVRQRKADAGRERGARIAKGRDGMAMLYALLHSEEAAVLAEALEEKVAADRAAEQLAADRAAEAADAAVAEPVGADADAAPGGQGYSMAQRRADALLSLVCGDPNRPGDDAPGAGVTLRPKITVIAGRGAAAGQGCGTSTST